jgi:two-component system NtrC family sensor kinase
MTDFFAGQMDYIYFSYGLAFIMIAAVCYVMMQQKSQVLPWIWLGLFGLVHGIHEWLNIFLMTAEDSGLVMSLLVVSVVLSYLFLIEFGRAGMAGLRGKGPGGGRVYAPLLLLASLGCLGGIDGFDVAVRYLLGCVGGLWAARALYFAARRSGPRSRRWLFFASIAIGLYAIATAVSVPAVSFPPASWLNRDVFSHVFGFPIAMLRGALAIIAASSLWAFSRVPSPETGVVSEPKHVFRPVAAIVAVIGAGWVMTGFAGDVARDQTLKEANLYANSLSMQYVRMLEGAEHEALQMASSPEVIKALQSENPGDLQKAYPIISTCRNSRFLDSELPFCYLIDSAGRTVASCNRMNARLNKNESPFIRGLFRGGGGARVRDSISGVRGYYFLDNDLLAQSYYVVTPVRDEEKRSIGFIVIREPLVDFRGAIAKHPFCFLIDPHGIVFLSSRSDMLLASLWPLDERTREEVMASGRFGAGPFPPLLPGVVSDGQYASIKGDRVLVTRRHLGSNDWSLVLMTPIKEIRVYRIFAIFATFVFSGLIIGFFGALHFTRESAAQISLSERRHRSLVEGSPNCVVLFDGEGRSVTVNRSGTELLGRREEDLIGKKIGELWPVASGLDGVVADVLQGERRQFDVANARPDGRKVEWTAVLNPISDSNGDIRSFVGIFMDVTEQKEAEKELRRYHEHLEEMVRERTAELSEVNARLEQEIAERKVTEEELKRHREHLSELVREQTADLVTSNEFLQIEISERRRAEEELKSFSQRIETIINSSSDIILMKDRNFRFLVVNERCAKFFGAPIGDIIGKTDFDFMSVDEGRECRRSDEAALQDEGPHEAEERAGERWLNVVKQRVLDEAGNATGLVAVIRDITDRKRAEEELRKYHEHLEEMVRERTSELSLANERLNIMNEALRDSEERFRSLFDLASDSIFLLNAAASDGPLIVDANGAACKINGYPREELIGSPVALLDAPENAGFMPDIIKRIMTGSPVTFEVSHVRKDGHVFPLEVSAQLIHLSGRPYVLAIERDITERRRMEDALREVSRQQEAILNNIPDLAWLKDRESRFIAANGPMAAACGVSSADELVGRTDLDVWPEELAGGYMADDREVMSSGKRKRVEETMVDKDGNVHWIETIKTPIYNDGGEVIGTAGIARDITGRKKAEAELERHREHLVEMVEERTVELKTAVQLLTNEINVRKAAEETLKRSEAQFRDLSREFHTLLDAMPDTLILLSPDLEVMWANKSAASATGKTMEELTGRHCYSLWYNRSVPCDECYVLKSFGSGEAEQSQLLTPSGKLLDARAFPIKDEEGKVPSVIIVLSDITEKTALQAEAMRASHLASLGELAAGVAHEINNPINGIINYAQILANKIAAGTKEKDIAFRIIKEGDRIAGIVRGLLSFARERKEEKVPATIQKIMSDTITLTETQILKDGIDLTIGIPDGLPEILVNPQQIQQVFLNIISNARYALNQKYPGTHEAKKLVIVGEQLRVDGVPYVSITFRDSGTGIPADVMDKVMNPFFSTKPGGQGTGLGLSISHGIIRNHGGRLSLESVEGDHTKVRIDLPSRGGDGA